MSKFIFVTGGVVSSLGKGISGAAIGKLLKLHGKKVTMVKCDPYINVDAGTMSPYQHGEVFVTEDGAETDLDLGYYERFLNENMSKKNSVTAGQIYQTVIDKERRGQFLGATVQVIPHITNEIKNRFASFEKDYDVTIIEIGGTVGDIESLPFLEAARQLRLEKGSENVICVHVTLLPYMEGSDELKTKPTQHSVNKLREIGIDANMIICRTQHKLDMATKNKISLFCSVPQEAVIAAENAQSIYLVPEDFYKQNVDAQILKMLKMRGKDKLDTAWFKFIRKTLTLKNSINIVVAGKYSMMKDAYKSVNEALEHAAWHNNFKVNIEYLNTENEEIKNNPKLKNANGILVPGGFGGRGIKGKLDIIKYARENDIPFLGICLGMQCTVIECARTLAKLDADSTEFNENTKHPVVWLTDKQRNAKDKGASMSLGAEAITLVKGSKIYEAYKNGAICERYRHRYQFNPDYIPLLEKHGLKVTGFNKDSNLPAAVEAEGKNWFVAVQYHPEFKSTPMNAHPLFVSFTKAASKRK